MTSCSLQSPHILKAQKRLFTSVTVRKWQSSHLPSTLCHVTLGEWEGGEEMALLQKLCISVLAVHPLTERLDGCAKRPAQPPSTPACLLEGKFFSVQWGGRFSFSSGKKLHRVARRCSGVRQCRRRREGPPAASVSTSLLVMSGRADRRNHRCTATQANTLFHLV